MHASIRTLAQTKPHSQRITPLHFRVFGWTQALHVSRKEASGVIFKYPQVLNLSIGMNLKKTMVFYTGELKGSPADVRAAILGSPTLLGYSLSKRLNPRVKVMRSVGVRPNFVDHVWLVSSYTDLRFSKWVEKRLLQNVGANGRGNIEIRRRMKGYRTMFIDQPVP